MMPFIHEAAVGYLFLREEWEALFTRMARVAFLGAHGHGHGFNDTRASGEGHGKEAGHYLLDGAYPGVYLIPRNTA